MSKDIGLSGDGAFKEQKRVVYGYGLAYWGAPLIEEDITPKGREYHAPIYRKEDEIMAIERGWNPIRILSPLNVSYLPVRKMVPELVKALEALDKRTDYGRKDFPFIPDPTEKGKRFVNLVRWLTEATLNECGPGTGKPFNMLQERFVIIGLSPGSEYYDVQLGRIDYWAPQAGRDDLMWEGNKK